MEKRVILFTSLTREKSTTCPKVTSGREGEHMGLHLAGKDITEELDFAPHIEEVFEKVNLAGELV
jgi:predicted heme/steroid binding protein